MAKPVITDKPIIDQAEFNGVTIWRKEGGSIEISDLNYPSVTAAIKDLAEKAGVPLEEKWNTQYAGWYLIQQLKAKGGRQASPSSPEPESIKAENPILKQCMKWMGEQNIEAQIDSDGDLKVSFQGITIFIYDNSDDLEYFKAISFIWDIIDSEAKKIAVLKAANAVNSSRKFIKVMVSDKHVQLANEFLLDKDPDLASMLKRTLINISGSRQRFLEELAKL